jgi:hypothetical protein
MAKTTQNKPRPFPAKQGSPLKASRLGQYAKTPPRGPSNLIVRSSNPLPLPKDTASQ